MQSIYRQFWNCGALHTGTETGFTGSGSLIWIQCGLDSRLSSTRHADYMHCTAGLVLTQSRSTVMQHSELLRFGSMPCGGKVVFGSGSPIHIGLWIQGPMWRAPVCYCRECRQVCLPMTKIMTQCGEPLQKSVHKASKKKNKITVLQVDKPPKSGRLVGTFFFFI